VGAAERLPNRDTIPAQSCRQSQCAAEFFTIETEPARVVAKLSPGNHDQSEAKRESLAPKADIPQLEPEGICAVRGNWLCES